VKLLLDENLSPRLVDLLRDVSPDLRHIQFVGLQGHSDPPKVVWLGVGNAGTQVIAAFVRSQAEVIRDFSASMDDGLLVLELFTGQD
jgi:predicted nuclease of predicted toxin-antitoxin system